MTKNPTARPVARIVRGVAASDGAGVRLTRIIGNRALPELDPFLMLDEFRSDESADYIGGFPDHPHRGFETVTYMLAGRMRHGDNQGNAGELKPGGAQWMTAGRGIIHSEMPQQENGLLWGFQLWVNLPAKDKMTAPNYQDIEPDRIPVVTIKGGASVRVVAGQVAGVSGPIATGVTDPTYLDISLSQEGSFAHNLPADYTAFVYVYDGAARVGPEVAPTVLQQSELAILAPGDEIRVTTDNGPARLLLVAGRPLHEPIARSGPFVMNTESELRQAFADFHAGRF